MLNLVSGKKEESKYRIRLRGMAVRAEVRLLLRTLIVVDRGVDTIYGVGETA